MKFKPSLLACAVLSGLVGLTGCNDDTTNIYEGGDTNPALPDIPDGGKQYVLQLAMATVMTSQTQKHLKSTWAFTSQ